MNVGGWLKQGGKKRIKRQLSISQPLNFEHIEHIGLNGDVKTSKKLSSSLQNIAELCKALARKETSSSGDDDAGSNRCSRTTTPEADLFSEITNSLAPDLKSFLITDTSEEDSSDRKKSCEDLSRMGCGTSKDLHPESNLSIITSPVKEGPAKPIRTHKTLRKVSQGKHSSWSDELKPSATKIGNHLQVEGLYSADKENMSNNLPPPITPRTAKKLKLKDEMFKDMIKKYCNKEDPSSRLKEIKKLGQGSSGVVMLVTDCETEKKFALKKMNLHRQQRRDLLVNEVSVGSLIHPNIVRTFSTHLVADELWVLMEPLDAGSLTQLVENLHIAKLTDRHIATICHGAVSALNYLHSLGVVHRDIKSDSILLSSTGQVKLSDFGYCDRITEEKSTCTGLIGTPHWMSPEIVGRKNYGLMTDIWSLGILVIEMLDGEPPNFSDSQIIAMEKIKISPPPSPRKLEISSPVLSFLSCCLKLEPELRASARSLLDHQLFDDEATPQELANLVSNFYANFKDSPIFK